MPKPLKFCLEITMDRPVGDGDESANDAAIGFAMQLDALLKREDWGYGLARVASVKPASKPKPVSKPRSFEEYIASDANG